MKKILTIILVVAMLISTFVSCNKDKGENGDSTLPGNVSDNSAGSTPSQDTPGNDGENTVKAIDYLNDDLSEYIEIDEKYYKNYTVVIDPNRITKLDVENQIIQILCYYKNKEAVEGDGIVSVGDVVEIYYKGYYLEDGKKVYFDGGSNDVEGAKAYSLEIGSGGFIAGFEYNLIGVNANEHSETPVLVESFFPENYHTPALAGVTAYFEVRIVGITEYDAPEFDEAFIKETLEITEESVANYEGETIVDKVRSLLADMYLHNNNLDEESLKAKALKESILGGMVIKNMPQSEIDGIYNSIVADINDMYTYYQYYYTYDQLASMYLSKYYGINSGNDWKAALKSYAEEQVLFSMAIFYIMDKENMMPSETEYNEMFDDYLKSALEESGITKDKYQTEQEYIDACEKYRNNIITKNGESYFRELLYYRHTYATLLSLAVVS